MMGKLALLVGAEPGMSDVLRQALEPAGIERLTISSTGETPAHLQSTKFDVVLVNLCGSPVHGVALTRRLRESGPNRLTPVILISGDQSKGTLPNGFDAGASFFVCLPIGAERLTKLIANITAIEQRSRRFRRVAKSVPVVLATAHAEIEGETIDLSLGGMLVKVPRTLPIGALVEVSLFLPWGINR
jgi:DNA-binding response OmpR family regulator